MRVRYPSPERALCGVVALAIGIRDRRNRKSRGLVIAFARLAGLALLFASGAALAGMMAGFNRVPEPGSFEPLALGGVVAAVIARRSREKQDGRALAAASTG